MKKLFISILFLLSGFFIFAEGNIRSISSVDFSELCLAMYDTINSEENTQNKEYLLKFEKSIKEIYEREYNEQISEEDLKVLTIRLYFKTFLESQDNVSVISGNKIILFDRINHVENIISPDICNINKLLDKIDKGYFYIKNTNNDEKIINVTELINSGNYNNIICSIFFGLAATSILSDEYAITTQDGETYTYVEYQLYYLKDNELYFNNYLFGKY